MFAFQSGPTVGEQNVEALELSLRDAGIPIVARDCGSGKGRRMTFDVSSGQITVESLGLEPKHL